MAFLEYLVLVEQAHVVVITIMMLQPLNFNFLAAQLECCTIFGCCCRLHGADACDNCNETHYSALDRWRGRPTFVGKPVFSQCRRCSPPAHLCNNSSDKMLHNFKSSTA